MNTNCPVCEVKTEFTLLPIFPGKSPFGNQTPPTYTNGLIIRCNKCSTDFTLGDFGTYQNLKGLQKQIEFLEERIKALE